MRALKLFCGTIFLSCLGLCPLVQADQPRHTLALGTTYLGAQIHWGFSDRWAIEARVLTGEEEDSTNGTITGAAYGLRGYWYFRRPSRIRFFGGLEAAATKSTAKRTDYETTGTALGIFAGTELYLLKRLSIGVDVGPYFLNSKVRKTDVSINDVDFVVNSFMNFYFL